MENDYYICRHEQNEGILNKKTNKRYATTLLALTETENFDDLVGYTDLTLPSVPEQELYQLYQDRFEDLRHKNDYLELWWSGGYDSTNILEVSMSCGKPVDAITMYCRGDPFKDNTGANAELNANIWHVNKYLSAFPKTKINLLDIDDMYEIERRNTKDYQRWTWASPYGMLEDIARLSADALMPERHNQQGTIITGKGYGGVVYNQNFDVWSYYCPALDMNYPGAFSEQLPITRFYSEGRIIRKTCGHARQWFYRQRPDFEKTWSTTEKSDHDNSIRYPALAGKIMHCGKGDNWQTNQKFSHIFSDDKSVYWEYWEFIDWLDKKLSPGCYTSGTTWVGNMLRQVEPAVIDF